MYTLTTRRKLSRVQLAYLATLDRYGEPAALGSLDARSKIRAAEDTLLDWGRAQSYQLATGGKMIDLDLIGEAFNRGRRLPKQRERLIELVMRLSI